VIFSGELQESSELVDNLAGGCPQKSESRAPQPCSLYSICQGMAIRFFRDVAQRSAHGIGNVAVSNVASRA
jgi:hypothetical protein